MRHHPPTRDRAEAARHLAALLRAPDPDRFRPHLRRLHTRFAAYAATCPLPQIAGDMAVSPELRCQSELYLPLGEITPAFHRLYRESLAHTPILDSTPFHTALSWADLYAGLPPRFRISANPALLLEALLRDADLRLAFLCHSFLPRRFYGGFCRYPGQRVFLADWLQQYRGTRLRCLDAACGTGEEGHALALMFHGLGWPAERFHIAGWTIEPLEVWAAACGRFPHDPGYEALFRRATAGLFAAGATASLSFAAADLLQPTTGNGDAPFDLILCNGLLGGPIVHQPDEVSRVLDNLLALLAPKGMLLIADSFHGGWKRKHPQHGLRVLLESRGLIADTAGEGLAAHFRCS